MVMRLWTAYRLELRQIFRQWSYWAIQALLLVYIFSTFGNNNFFSAQELLLAGASRNVIGVGTLMTLIFGVFSAGRADRNRLTSIELALPVGAELSLGRWLALVTAMLPFLASGIVVALHAGPLESFWRGLPVYLLESVLTLVFTSLLVWLLVVTLGTRRWLFVLVVMLWLGSIFTISLVSVPLTGPWVGLLNFTRFGYGAFSPVWERLPLGVFPALLNGFYFGAGLLLFALILRVLERRRFYRTPRAVSLLAGAGLVIAVACYGLYGMNFIRANAEMIAYRDPYIGMVYVSDQPQDIVYSASRYDIHLDVTDTPVFTVEMDVVNNSAAPLDALSFGLLSALTVQSASLPHTHDEDTLVLQPESPLAAGESLTVRLVYGGEVALYSFIWGAVPEMSTFITDGGIALHPAVAWYPRVAGYENGTTRLPAHVRLRVEGARMPLVSNLEARGDGLFESERVFTLWLAGSELVRLQHPAEGVMLVMGDANYMKMRVMIEAGFRYTAPTMKRYFPEPYIIGSPWARWSPYAMQSAYPLMVHSVVADLLGDDASTQLAENIARFIWLQVEEQTAAQMREAVALLVPDGPTHDMPSFAPAGRAMNYAVTLRLIDIYETHGTAVTIPLVAALRADFSRLAYRPSVEVIAWMDAWVEENPGDV